MENMQFLDPEQFNQLNEKLDFKFILMRQIDKVRLSRSTEMRGGYWEERPISMGSGHSFMRVYIPDTRETYINSVLGFRSLLIPYWDNEYKEQEKKLKDKYYNDEEKERERIKNIKEMDESDIKHHLNDSEGHMESRWIPENRVKHYDLIFEELLRLCVRAKLINGNNLIEDEI